MLNGVRREFKTDDGAVWLMEGDCLDVLAQLEANSVDAVITDPPYGLTFMGKDWDRGVPGVAFWEAALRVAKPGAHLLAFGGTRTFHRLTCAIEDAGWEIRDCVMWVYGSGFPKSLDVSKAIDKAAGAKREVIGELRRWGNAAGNGRGGQHANGYEPTVHGAERFDPITAPATENARQWSGWGTALKPAWEPIIVARKPLIGTVAENVQEWGTGALNVDGGRIAAPDGDYAHSGNLTKTPMARNSFCAAANGDLKVTQAPPNELGRWPANLIHDGSDEVLGLFPQAKAGGKVNGKEPSTTGQNGIYGHYNRVENQPFTDSGSAARFFYCAKASKGDRESGNIHPTVKPTDLMQYLCRLVTPKGGVVLDMFAGSFSTGKAAILEGCSFIGIERESKYFDIGAARFTNELSKTSLFDSVPRIEEDA